MNTVATSSSAVVVSTNSVASEDNVEVTVELPHDLIKSYKDLNDKMEATISKIQKKRRTKKEQ